MKAITPEESAALRQLAEHSPPGSLLYRCGRHAVATVRDEAGRPVVGISDLSEPAPIMLYLVERDNVWTYVAVLSDGSMTSVAWPRAPGFPRQRWRP